ncbi:hypothetical protein F2P81_015244 [Scophthalmus maximus]|uniref:DUF4582 domain containing protein n=1 Tax=Scophthalmus maximus TaxID=52904 RepID=A0A6A4SPH1_SCOMX|nr:hypothetical protein F2P81_015244 [Scophthalmus maximus]
MSARASVNTTLPSLQEQDTASFVPWSHDDPHELINCVQSSLPTRKPPLNTEYDFAADLQGLVSNILAEAQSQDSYPERSLPTCNPFWSPKTLKEELLRYFQSETKAQHSPTFPSNYVSHEAFGKAQGQSVHKDVEEFSQQPNGIGINQQWHFNLANGDSDHYTLHPQKLQMPKVGNTYMSQMQQSNCDNTSADKDRGDNQPADNFPHFNDVFTSQGQINSPGFDPYYEDNCSQSSAKHISNVPQDINQLVSSFQSFMAREPDSLCHRDFPNMHKQTFGMLHEDSAAEQWKITSPTGSTQSAPAMQTQKEPVGEYGIVQRNGGARKQSYKRDVFQNHLLEEPYSASVNLPNQYQNKTRTHRENSNVSANQYPKHHMSQGQVQNKIKPQMQKEKKTSGFLGEAFSKIPLTSTHMRDGDKKQIYSQSPCFDLQGGMQPQRFNGENSMVSAGNSTHQCMPLMYPASHPRGRPGTPIYISSRSTLPYGGAAPGTDVREMMTHRGDSLYHGRALAVLSPMVMNQGGPVIQLYVYLDECYEQWKCLEKERKRAEAILNKTFDGKRTAAVANASLPKTPPNPTRVDHLVVKQMREQSKVVGLLCRMESLTDSPLHINISTAPNTHHKAICNLQTRRKEEIAHMSKHPQQRSHITERQDVMLFVALKDLAAATRKLRTALWCALQMTLPKPVKKQQDHIHQAAARREQSASPLEGYSFRF